MTNFEIIELHRPYELHSPFEGEFVALIVANDPEIDADEQSAISEALVAQGCRYAVCAGVRASSWDDSVDYAYLSTDPNFDPPDSRFVMTTWHDNQSPEEIVFFFANCTKFDDFEPQNFLAVFIGSNPSNDFLVTLQKYFPGT